MSPFICPVGGEDIFEVEKIFKTADFFLNVYGANGIAGVIVS